MAHERQGVLNIIQSLSRSQKRIVMMGIDLLILPNAFAGAVFMQALSVSLGDLALQLVALGPYMVAITIGLAYWYELPKLRLKDFDGGTVLRYATFTACVTMFFIPVGFVGGLDVPISTFVLFGCLFFAIGTLIRLAMRQMLIELYRRAGNQHQVLI